MAIFIMAAYPSRARWVFVAPFRYEVEIVVGGVDEVDAAGVGGVRMKDAAVVAPQEDTQPLALRIARRKSVVVVDNLVGLPGPERNAVVVVESLP